MIAEFYINFKAKKKYQSLGLAGAPKTSIKKPATSSDEVCVKMSIEIPDVLFERPVLEIKGKIDCAITKENQLIIANEAKSLIEKKLNLKCEITE